jgi:L-seryl-tRNA(Ser) seleniumtransferase
MHHCEGASLVAYSGGKAIHGPQGTGILCGQKDLVAAALIQQLDMDILAETWMPPVGLLDSFLKDRLPHHGLGRGFKVDKESIAGLLVALERFVVADDGAANGKRETQLRRLADLLADIKCRATVLSAAETKRYPILEIQFDEESLGFGAVEISRRLQRQSIPVHLSERRIYENVLLVDASGLRPDDEQAIASALAAALK